MIHCINEKNVGLLSKGRGKERERRAGINKQNAKPEWTLTEEHQDGANPLHRTHDIAEQNNRAEDGEELPRGGDDGAGQRPEVHHGHKDEGLLKETHWGMSFGYAVHTTLPIISWYTGHIKCFYESTHLA